MHAQSFLTLLRDHYSFNQAQQVLTNTQIKGLWESWFNADMLHRLSWNNAIEDIDTDSPYPAVATEEASGSKIKYLSLKAGETEAKLVEKRHSSKADYRFSVHNATLYCEGFCAQASGQIEPKDIRRMSDLMQRSKRLKAQNNALNIVSYCVLWGFIESSQMKKLKPLDNSRTLSYVLDTHIQGSSSIARLSALSNVETPRILVIASSV